MPSRVSLSPALEVSKRPSPFQRFRHLWQYRELLGNLVRKELKVKYKNSVLGFVWSLLNPLMYLVVFSVVFQVVLQVKVPYYAIFFLSGLLAWNFFSAGSSSGTTRDRGERPAGDEGVVPARGARARRRSARRSCTSSCRASCCSGRL